MKRINIALIIIILFSQVLFPGYGKKPASGTNGIVSTDHPIATKVGIEILKKGGNAVDAAVAIGFTLSVILPTAGNIGGGGFMLIHTPDGKVIALDYREKAPLAATTSIFLKPDGTVDNGKLMSGYLAPGVPGTVKGFWEVHKKYGKLSWAEVVTPAIKYAREGFQISERLSDMLNERHAIFIKYKNSKVFVHPSGKWKPGDTLFQKDLAKTLERIATNGVSEFYNGETARELVKSIQENNGIITLKDLQSYSVKWRKPVGVKFRGYTVYGMPPPSSGGMTLGQMLKMFEMADTKCMTEKSSDYYHLIAEIMRRAFKDRARYPADPDFITVPIKQLLNDDYLKRSFSSFNPNKATDSKDLADISINLKESDHTTHYSVIDKWGNAVSNTYTLNSHLGSKAVAGKTGILLNNQLDDFAILPESPNQYELIGSSKNKIEPGKRMLSSMTPTIAVKTNDKIILLGCPGGPKITTSVFQVLLHYIHFGYNIREAVESPRMHHQWIPDRIKVEKNRFSQDLINNLKKLGHKFEVIESMGPINAAIFDYTKRIFYGSSDLRLDGIAIGY